MVASICPTIDFAAKTSLTAYSLDKTALNFQSFAYCYLGFKIADLILSSKIDFLQQNHKFHYI